MERILQPFPGASPPSAPALAAAPASHAWAAQGNHHATSLASAAPKTVGDYFRALKRRVGLALAIAVVVGVAGSAYVVRQPNVYRASAQLKIDAPQFDSATSLIVPGGEIGRIDSKSIETYVPNLIALLRGSKSLAEKAVMDADVRSLPEPGGGDPAADLLANLSTRPLLPATNAYEVQLEGKNPERVAKLLNALLKYLQREATEGNDHKIKTSNIWANANLKQMTDELRKIDADVKALLTSEALFAPGGVNLYEKNHAELSLLISQKRARHDELVYEARIAKFYPESRPAPPLSKAELSLEQLTSEQLVLQRRLDRLGKTLRDRYNDPAYRHVNDELERVKADAEALRAKLPKRRQAPDLAAIALRHSGAEIERLGRDADELLAKLKDSMPAHQTYLTLLQDRERKAIELSATRERLAQFLMLSKTQNDPVRIESQAVEPSSPVRPKRAASIAMFAVLGLVLGTAAVCLLEFLDHSVKVPEHLTAGLGLPLFGVIPRMRRLSALQRGGHLWAAGAPTSVEADAYRNLRASLLGLTGPRGPIVTLLVTSAKAGEGKSTTALNLAATCARAGERTLLVDVDLRRPSLADVFDDGTYRTGLVDILRGDLPWQRTVIHSDLPNLDFLPTGDPAEVPIEILGTLELRQLLSALSGHYDRVILDGPAVLGMADCRMLGRMVDSALLVVRSGAHELRPLQRAKAMLEQSRVPVAGIVFNSVSEDYENWSSYGARAPYMADLAATRGLDASPIDAAALVAHSTRV